MKVPAEFAGELGAFPTALRELVQAELESGNTIASIEHGFPAAPCGASIKLTRPVNAQRRKSGNGLSFYERNHPAYAGEFTTQERHFFVLEPPNPPPPEPDMDAIRKAHEPMPDPLVQLAHRRAGSIVERIAGRPFVDAAQAVVSTETPTSRTHLLHFRDCRPPHEIQFALERELMTLFTATMTGDRLHLLAKATVTGATYDFDLCFVAALEADNCYSLRTQISWAKQPATHHDYYRKTSASWIEMWTRHLTPANPPAVNDDLTEHYRTLCQAALQAEAQLDSVAALQQAIVAGLKRGGKFTTSHKEGGTNIFWRTDRFIRSDYGECPDQQEFRDEAEFLKMLRQFCHWDVARNAGPDKLSEFDAWKLILRRLRK